jgi:cysteine desulfurase
MPEPIYLDHNATTPLLPEVAEIMLGCWKSSNRNPASQHSLGRHARRVLEGIRMRIGELLGLARDDSLVFTSGGTESNNLAIRGLLQRAGASSPPSSAPAHLIISAIEHPSITALANELQRTGHQLDVLPVDSNGVIRVECLEGLLKPNTALVAAIKGQNETGVLQPIADLAEICNRHNVPLHTDAAQAVGKIPINFHTMGVATMTIAAHKFHGPVGIGALAIRKGVELHPQLFGGFQQGGIRPGTESLALAAGMHCALDLGYPDHNPEIHFERLRERSARMRELRDRFEQHLLAAYPDAVVVGAQASRLPHTSNIAFVGIERQMLFLALDQAGVACSTGSACASGSSETSPVLMAMGCEKAVLESSLRFSLGATTTADEVDEAVRRIITCCNNLRRGK